MTELETQLLAAFEQQQGLLEQLQRDYGQALSELQQQLLALSESRPRERSRPPAGQSPCATCRHSWTVKIVQRGERLEEYGKPKVPYEKKDDFWECLLRPKYTLPKDFVEECSQFEP